MARVLRVIVRRWPFLVRLRTSSFAPGEVRNRITKLLASGCRPAIEVRCDRRGGSASVGCQRADGAHRVSGSVATALRRIIEQPLPIRRRPLKRTLGGCPQRVDLGRPRPPPATMRGGLRHRSAFGQRQPFYHRHHTVISAAAQSQTADLRTADRSASHPDAQSKKRRATIAGRRSGFH